MKFKVNSRVLSTFLAGGLILLGSVLAIQYAQGKYRFTQQGLSRETGLLAANSFPPGAQIYIDGDLTSATDDTLYLKPGEYLIELKKDGYSPWQKKLRIQKELVTQTNAQLFPIAPSLTPLTFTGVENLSISPDGQKILYYTASASAQSNNGLFVTTLNDSIIPFRSSSQIAIDQANIDLKSAQFIWSPDGSLVIMITPDKEYLLDLSKKNDLASLPDVSSQKANLLTAWDEELILKNEQFLDKFPDEVIELASASATNIYFSPDRKRLLYTATADLILKDDLLPPVPAANNQPENRAIKAENTYIYDREEDKNFLLGSTTTGYQWFSDSKHVIYQNNGAIRIKSYDGSNDTLIYSGPFSPDFLFPSPDGRRLLILTSFSSDSPPNLYALELK